MLLHYSSQSTVCIDWHCAVWTVLGGTVETRSQPVLVVAQGKILEDGDKSHLLKYGEGTMLSKQFLLGKELFDDSIISRIIPL
jgi:hypothetical protein